jgi:hypothetical protein
MSISARHQIVKFTSGASKAIGGQRLAKLQWKTTAKQKAAYENHCVSLPVFSEEELIQSVTNGMFIPQLREIVENGQRDLIKGLFEQSGGMLKEVADSEISLSMIENWFIAQSAKEDSFNSEAIGKWFDSEVSENLSVLLCERLSLDDPEHEMIVKTLKIFRAIVCMVSGKDFRPSPKQLKGIHDCLDCGLSDHWVGKKIQGKMDIWNKTAEEDEALFAAALG